jgi:hypothetical protein
MVERNHTQKEEKIKSQLYPMVLCEAIDYEKIQKDYSERSLVWSECARPFPHPLLAKRPSASIKLHTV